MRGPKTFFLRDKVLGHQFTGDIFYHYTGIENNMCRKIFELVLDNLNLLPGTLSYRGRVLSIHRYWKQHVSKDFGTCPSQFVPFQACRIYLPRLDQETDMRKQTQDVPEDINPFMLTAAKISLTTPVFWWNIAGKSIFKNIFDWEMLIGTSPTTPLQILCKYILNFKVTVKSTIDPDENCWMNS